MRSRTYFCGSTTILLTQGKTAVLHCIQGELNPGYSRKNPLDNYRYTSLGSNHRRHNCIPVCCRIPHCHRTHLLPCLHPARDLNRILESVYDSWGPCISAGLMHTQRRSVRHSRKSRNSNRHHPNRILLGSNHYRTTHLHIEKKRGRISYSCT